MPEIPPQSTRPATADDMIDMFKELDVEEPKKEVVKEEVKEKENKKEEEIKLKEPESENEELDLEDKSDGDDEDDEDDEEEDDKEENLDIEAPPRKKEILKAYPDLFKKFPFLEKMMYRDRQVTELFGSFDDAKEIAEKYNEVADKIPLWNEFESQLLEGNTEQLLKEVKSSDERAFNIIVDEYLPTLAKVDKEAYFQVVGNLNKRLIVEMVKEANDTDNDDLKQAAVILNQFVFGNSKFTPPTNRVNKEEPVKDSKIEEERLSFIKERFEVARDDLQSQVDNTLRATISEYIDPKGVMSPYVKKNAIADAMQMLSSSIGEDKNTVKNLDKLWKDAFENKFSKDALGKIKSFYLSKAKSNLKNVILKSRAEALKDSAPSKREEDQEEETPSRRRNIIPGRSSQPTRKTEMQKGETVTDFFMRD